MPNARLIAAMTARKVTCAYLAEVCGVTQTAVHYWRMGIRNPWRRQAEAVSDVLGYPVDELGFREWTRTGRTWRMA